MAVIEQRRPGSVPRGCGNPACLPSGNAAVELFRGGSPVPVIETFLLRGGIIALGLGLAGARGMDLLKYTVAAASAIEAGVLVWAFGVSQRTP
jgi:hypothetical protein